MENDSISNLDKYFFTQFLEPEEKINLVIHHHWWALVKPLLTTAIFGISIPILGMWVFSGRYTIPIGILWLFVGIGYLIYHLIDWFYDAIVLTDSNILDIEWKGVFHKIANRISYDHIDSVSYTVKGVFPTLFHFGDLIISTTGEGEKGMIMTRDVREIQKIILAACEEVKEAKGENETEALKKAIKALLSGQEAPDEEHEESIEIQADHAEDVMEEESEDANLDTTSVMILETKSIEDKVPVTKSVSKKKVTNRSKRKK